MNAATAIPGVDRSTQGAVYKGLATMSDRLYATDFHNGRVDVFDASFNPVPLAGGFQDKKLPKGFAPFGIQALAGNIFVTYAKQDSAKHDDVAGPGLGYVDEFTPDGKLVARVASAGAKRAGTRRGGSRSRRRRFGVFAGDVLVGNFGNGRISAYQQRGGTWVYKGQLRLGDGTLLSIDGLWAIAFGNGAAAGPRHALLRAPGRAARARAVRRDHRDGLGGRRRPAGSASGRPPLFRGHPVAGQIQPERESGPLAVGAEAPLDRRVLRLAAGELRVRRPRPRVEHEPRVAAEARQHHVRRAVRSDPGQREQPRRNLVVRTAPGR